MKFLQVMNKFWANCLYFESDLRATNYSAKGTDKKYKTHREFEPKLPRYFPVWLKRTRTKKNDERNLGEWQKLFSTIDATQTAGKSTPRNLSPREESRENETAMCDSILWERTRWKTHWMLKYGQGKARTALPWVTWWSSFRKCKLSTKTSNSAISINDEGQKEHKKVRRGHLRVLLGPVASTFSSIRSWTFAFLASAIICFHIEAATGPLLLNR